MLADLSNGLPLVAGREQLFGYDQLGLAGFDIDCNLNRNRSGRLIDHVCGIWDRRYLQATGVGIGDLGGLLSQISRMNLVDCVFATSDNTGLALLRLKAYGALRSPLVYVSVGFPERINELRKRAPKKESASCRRFRKLAQVVAYGHAEAEWLAEWIGGEDRVTFVPFGVDVSYWGERGAEQHPFQYDVISVGVDPMRDFGLLLRYAAQNPRYRFGLVVGQSHASELKAQVPSNMTVHVDIPVDEVRALMLQSKVVVLPVKENTYSGATTTLLQAMALGRPVIVSQVGAIRDGYGFEGDVHLGWMLPGSYDSFSSSVEKALRDDAYREKLATEGKKHVLGNLTWDHYIERITNVMIRIMKEQK